MSIQSEINRIRGNVASAYSAVEEKGGSLPAEQNSENLAAAVRGIPSSGGTSGEVWSTNETAIGTWIDGKTVYRRVIHVAGTVDDVLADIDNVETFTHYYGTIINNGEGSGLPVTLPVPCIDIDRGFSVAVSINHSYGIMEVYPSDADGGSFGNLSLCLEYTKKQDSLPGIITPDDIDGLAATAE